MERPLPERMVGRDRELAAVSSLLDHGLSGPRLLIVDGEAGMGKTMCWRAAVSGANERDMRVLACAPAETEVGLPHAALHDLLGGVPDDAIAALPHPQARALEVALFRYLPQSEAVDPAALSIGTATLLRQLAQERPLLLAIDDFQWLDPSSVAVLRFCLRRLDTAPIAVLVCRRSEVSGGAPRQDLAPDSITDRITLRPLSLGALHRVVQDRLGVQLARPTLVRLHAWTGGNPYATIELVRTYGPEGADPVALGSPLPDALKTALGRRVGSLPAPIRTVVEATAVLGRPTRDILQRVVGEASDGLSGRLAKAERAGLIRMEEERVRIDHPLLASLIAGSMGAEARRVLHRRISAVLDDGPERARHLAGGSDGPDEAIAAALDSAAGSASARGASVEAADLRALALRLTPVTDARSIGRRSLSLADALFTAGDTGQARRRVETIMPEVADADQRLEAALLLATILWFEDETEAAVAIAEDGLAQAPDDAWRARFHARLSWMVDYDLSRQLTHATRALELTDPDAEPALYAFALLNHAWTSLISGAGAQPEAIALGDKLQESAGIWEFSTIPANWAKAMDDFGTARDLLRRYLDRARVTGDESSLSQLLAYLAELECWAGEVDTAERLAEEAVEVAEQTGQSVYLALSLARRGLVHAYRGDLAAARATAERSLSLSNPPVLPPVPLGVLGFLALTGDDPEGADRVLSEADAMLEGVGIHEPASYRFHADHIEAVIRLGDLERAERLLERFESRARALPRPWISATSRRCRAMFEAGRGDVPAALAAFEDALEAHETLSMPLELGRTLLAQGVTLRRSGQRRAAQVALERALALFQEVGCQPWAGKAVAEVGRLGLRKGQQDELTPSEERIARMAAGGLTNRVIAERLSISPKTVEASLARAYSKLGIRSRAELGARFAVRGTEPG